MTLFISLIMVMMFIVSRKQRRKKRNSTAVTDFILTNVGSGIHEGWITAQQSCKERRKQAFHHTPISLLQVTGMEPFSEQEVH